MNTKLLLLAVGLYLALYASVQAQDPSVADYPSIQAAIDANPGKIVHVPQGDFVIQERIRIKTDGAGLEGHGRIIQDNPAEPVIEILAIRGVLLRGLTITRADGAQDAEANGILCRDARGVVLENLQVLECRARDAAIELRDCTDTTIRGCSVGNYKRIAVDDRTGPGENLYGYAFIAIDGTGILVKGGSGLSILDNRITEDRLLPTRENKDQYRLGSLTEGRYPSEPGELAKGVFEQGYVSNWHQGSAIVVTGPETTSKVIVRGNHIRNAAQGIDLHCDHALVESNIVDHGMMGIKATHGCLNLIIRGNLLECIDLWGILLNPGAASHAGRPATEAEPAKAPNVDAGIIVAHNIITDYGRGHEYWNWGGAQEDLGASYPIALYEGQLDTNPPLTDVLIQGNMVYDTGRELAASIGQPEPARYRYAVYVGPWSGAAEPGPTYPKNVRFLGNLFHPGARGVSNVVVEP